MVLLHAGLYCLCVRSLAKRRLSCCFLPSFSHRLAHTHLPICHPPLRLQQEGKGGRGPSSSSSSSGASGARV